MDNVKNADNSSYNGGALLRMGLNDNKAGMQGLDKEKINKIIMEASKVGLIVFIYVFIYFSLPAFLLISPFPLQIKLMWLDF